MTRKINTEFINPPIGIRWHDWIATYDDLDYDDEHRNPVGRGATEQEAIDDLLSQEE